MAFLHTETDDNDLTYFLLHQAEVIRRSIAALHGQIEERSRRLRALEVELRGMIDLNRRQRELIGHALRHPGQVYTVESHRSSHNVVTQTARTDLQDLVERGLWTSRRVTKAIHYQPARDLEERLSRAD